jgi:hypothetical protein
MIPSKTTRPARYRVYQFFVALKATLPVWAGGVKGGLSAADERLVTSILPAANQQQLFARMSPNDQRHALAVARSLQQAGYHNRALLQAALLHDVAKSLGQPIIHRVLIVLLEAFWPAALKRLSIPSSPTRERGEPGEGWWRRPFMIHAQHPAIGAEWAQSAGCDPLAVSLIARHQDLLSPVPTGPEDELLAALQWADNSN